MSDSAEPAEGTNERRHAHSDGFADSVYRHLRAMAQKRLATERTGHTLGATALVHEVYLKLASRPPLSQGGASRGGSATGPDGGSVDRRVFFHAASEAMRQILIDHARARQAKKRGGGAPAGPRDGWVIENVEQLADSGDSASVLALDAAFVRLEKEDPQAAEVVRLRFYAGRSVDETAAVLGVSRRSVLREWAFARAFLKDCVKVGDDGSEPARPAK